MMNSALQLPLEAAIGTSNRPPAPGGKHVLFVQQQFVALQPPVVAGTDSTIYQSLVVNLFLCVMNLFTLLITHLFSPLCDVSL